jgi:hypothetical protein
MSQLVQLNDTKQITGWHLVTKDYTKEHDLCRHGVWVGLLEEFSETVTFAYEHSNENLYVGWAINGTTVVDPGYGSGTPPEGLPCPGAPSVTFHCPVDGYFHEISLTSTPGDPDESLAVQVLYVVYPNPDTILNGPFTYVDLAGSETIWPAHLVQEANACYAAFWEKLHQYVAGPGHVAPGDPVEWLAGLPAEVAVRLEAEVATLTQLDAQAQPRLAKAIQDDLMGILRGRRFGAGGAQSRRYIPS